MITTFELDCGQVRVAEINRVVSVWFDPDAVTAGFFFFVKDEREVIWPMDYFELSAQTPDFWNKLTDWDQRFGFHRFYLNPTEGAVPGGLYTDHPFYSPLFQYFPRKFQSSTISAVSEIVKPVPWLTGVCCQAALLDEERLDFSVYDNTKLMDLIDEGNKTHPLPLSFFQGLFHLSKIPLAFSTGKARFSP